MPTSTHAIQVAIAQLLHAVPDPTWWSGSTASACSARIDDAVAQLRLLEQRILASGHS